MGKNVKEKVLSVLNEYRGRSYSGEELANAIGVSRTAVWKAINSLREEGYMIEGSTGTGYTLFKDTDILDRNEIIKNLSSDAAGFYDVGCVKETGSTNDDIKEKGMAGASEGLTLISEKQTAGKGRRGRSFYSPMGTGLYLSILLKPDLSFEDSVLITTAASVAAANAIEAVNPDTRNKVGIKWVNDLFLNGRKIAGILTEGNISMETGRPDFIVMGIGFNLRIPDGDWPENIKDIAGGFFEDRVPAGSRNKLAYEFLNNFYALYKALPDPIYLNEYRERQVATGKTVTVSFQSEERKAKVIGVNDKCELKVIFQGDTKESTLNSGEISIRL